MCLHRKIKKRMDNEERQGTGYQVFIVTKDNPYLYQSIVRHGGPYHPNFWYRSTDEIISTEFDRTASEVTSYESGFHIFESKELAERFAIAKNRQVEEYLSNKVERIGVAGPGYKYVAREVRYSYVVAEGEQELPIWIDKADYGRCHGFNWLYCRIIVAKKRMILEEQ